MGLTGRFLTASVLADIAASTSSAGTMMERIGGRAQGQMSRGGCGKSGANDLHEGALNGEPPVCRIFLWPRIFPGSGIVSDVRHQAR